jgi:hypothetical protein
MQTKENIPNPGSDEAFALGYLCARIDNHYGKGVPSLKGPAFWITGACPLHHKQ